MGTPGEPAARKKPIRFCFRLRASVGWGRSISSQPVWQKTTSRRKQKFIVLRRMQGVVLNGTKWYQGRMSAGQQSLTGSPPTGACVSHSLKKMLVGKGPSQSKA
jgi:hypothetical protein